jgi:transposase
MNPVSTLGIDLAKSTFSLHGVDAHGAVVLRRGLSRAKLSELVAQLPPCLIGIGSLLGSAPVGCPHSQRSSSASFCLR